LDPFPLDSVIFVPPRNTARQRACCCKGAILTCPPFLPLTLFLLFVTFGYVEAYWCGHFPLPWLPLVCGRFSSLHGLLICCGVQGDFGPPPLYSVQQTPRPSLQVTPLNYWDSRHPYGGPCGTWSFLTEGYVVTFSPPPPRWPFPPPQRAELRPFCHRSLDLFRFARARPKT